MALDLGEVKWTETVQRMSFQILLSATKRAAIGPFWGTFRMGHLVWPLTLTGGTRENRKEQRRMKTHLSGSHADSASAVHV